jgi:hypothetical protein
MGHWVLAEQPASAGAIIRAFLDGKAIDKAAQCIDRLPRTEWVVEPEAAR